MSEFEDYLNNSNKYWSQALQYLKEGKLEKASEFAWGSVAARIKALAFVKDGREIRTHQEIRDYIKIVSKKINDKDMYQAYRRVEGLHRNFYECNMDGEDVKEDLLQAEALILKIDRLLVI